MAKEKQQKAVMTVQGSEITVFSTKNEDYISLTDMARYKNAEATGLVISHWLSSRYTVEFMGLWNNCITRILM
ncbi:KilA-N domain-containing protein [Brucepastera parasyntrophica]|uniref:KilA-N domain-containing protein n=1 Tax=Brucepastera parasyntrophica TaxID=2880008 RepID=UPI00210BCE98|nr:KilA-N domain-containing protein [Brucepastera parasyntrophica]